MEHTPGPWKIVHYFSDSDDAWFYSHTIEDSYENFICHTSMTSFWGGNDFNEEANARLIAQSPTMFDYCVRQAYDGDPDARSIVEAVTGDNYCEGFFRPREQNPT